MIYIGICLALGTLFTMWFKEKCDRSWKEMFFLPIVLAIMILILFQPLGLLDADYETKNESYPLYEVSGQFQVVDDGNNVSVLFSDDGIWKKETYPKDIVTISPDAEKAEVHITKKVTKEPSDREKILYLKGYNLLQEKEIIKSVEIYLPKESTTAE